MERKTIQIIQKRINEDIFEFYVLDETLIIHKKVNLNHAMFPWFINYQNTDSHHAYSSYHAAINGLINLLKEQKRFENCIFNIVHYEHACICSKEKFKFTTHAMYCPLFRK